MLIVVTGPSGSGKSTILRHVIRDLRGVKFSVSHTTRPRRPTEKDGRDYYFVSAADFQKMVAKDQFLEWAEVHGHYYGTAKKEIGSINKTGDVILDIDVQGARQIKALRRDAVFIFILPPVYSELKMRLQGRGEDRPEVIERRLDTARKEIRDYDRFEFVVINDRLDRAVLELESIILSSRCRIGARAPQIQAILQSFKPARKTGRVRAERER